MNPNERRAKQEGKCAAAFLKGDWILTAQSQGTPNGERVLVSIDPKKPVLKTLSDLGMREKMQEKFQEPSERSWSGRFQRARLTWPAHPVARRIGISRSFHA